MTGTTSDGVTPGTTVHALAEELSASACGFIDRCGRSGFPSSDCVGSGVVVLCGAFDCDAPAERVDVDGVTACVKAIAAASCGENWVPLSPDKCSGVDLPPR